MVDVASIMPGQWLVACCWLFRQSRPSGSRTYPTNADPTRPAAIMSAVDMATGLLIIRKLPWIPVRLSEQ